MSIIELILAVGVAIAILWTFVVAASAAKHDKALEGEIEELGKIQRRDDQWLRNRIATFSDGISELEVAFEHERKMLDELKSQFDSAKQTFTRELEHTKGTMAATFKEGERLLNGFQAKLSEGERRLKVTESNIAALSDIKDREQNQTVEIERKLNVLQAAIDASDAISLRQGNHEFKQHVGTLLQEVQNIQAQQTKVFGEIVETYRKGEVQRAQQANDVGVFEKRLDGAVETFNETRNLVKTLTAMVVEHIAEKQKTEDDLPELERVLQAWGKAPQPGVRPSVRKLGDELDVAEAKERSEIAEVSNMTSVTMKARPLTDEEARIVAGYATDYRHDIERTTGPGMRRVYDPTRDYRLPVNTKHGMCIVCGAGFEQTVEERSYCEHHAVTHYPGPREG